MNEEEWNALFLIPNGWATIPIIMMAGTLLNCPFITYTPLKPVVMGKKAAPDGVVRVEGDFTITKDWAAQGEVAGAIYIYNEIGDHYIPIYVRESPAQRLPRHDRELRMLQTRHSQP